MLKIYNSLIRSKEIFMSMDRKTVKLYVCGVTVYDYCHIGHARTYVAFDVVIRYLKWLGYDVIYVRNITDIDDKIIKRSAENKEEWSALVERFIHAMHDDFSALNLLQPDHEPRATEFIPQMIQMVEQLLVNGYAYVASNGDVYYDVRRFNKYGCLSHRDVDQLESGARVDVADVKRDPLDFVLWKMAKAGEPYWESPWGIGRPGWHLECSVMSTKLLGEQFDIHGGGKDLIFPHHENEIAQTEGVTQKQFVNIWMHAGFLQINKEKMSKSLNNFLMIREVIQQYHPESVRYFFITCHYRSQLAYSDEGLQQAHSALSRFYNALRDMPDAEEKKDTPFEKAFIDAMNDDFNTPVALSVLFELAHEVQRLREKDFDLASQYAALLKKLGGVLGILQLDPISFLQSSHIELDVTKVEQLIAERNVARLAKNFSESDRIRDVLLSMSVVLEDAPTGTTWKVVRQ